MAENTKSRIEYYVLLDSNDINEIAPLRMFQNIQVATTLDGIWLSQITLAQLDSIDVKSLLHKSVFEAKGQKLYLLDSLLPDRNLPEVLWVPIAQAVPVNIGPLNQNYFGINESLNLQLTPDLHEKKPIGLLAAIGDMSLYINTAPSFRLDCINWTIINGKQALLLGEPLLPIPGIAYWKKGVSLIPTGYNFELPQIQNQMANELAQGDNFVVWNIDGTYFLVPTHLIENLSLASFRKSVDAMERNQSLETNG